MHMHTHRHLRMLIIPSEGTSWQAAWIGLNYSLAKRNKQWRTKYFSMVFNNWACYLKRDTENHEPALKGLFIIHNTLQLRISAFGHRLTAAIEFWNSFFWCYDFVDPLPECQTATSLTKHADDIFIAVLRKPSACLEKCKIVVSKASQWQLCRAAVPNWHDSVKKQQLMVQNLRFW